MSDTARSRYADARAAFGTMSTAMITPFTPDGALDLAAAERTAAHLVKLGNDALVVSGTTGEAPTTSDKEKSELLAAVRGAVGSGVRLVAGVGTNDTAHTVELARQAQAAGADGVLVVAPYYSKPTQAGLAAHVRAVADAVDLPVMLYDIPGRSAVPFSTETLVELAAHPGVLAVKDAKGDLHATSTVLAATDLAYYSGEDALNFPLLAIGAIGLVSVVGHVAADRYRAMVEAVAAGDLATAARLHYEALPLVQAIMTTAPGVVTAKAALQLQGVLADRGTRLPLLPADDALVAVLRDALKKAGYLS